MEDRAAPTRTYIGIINIKIRWRGALMLDKTTTKTDVKTDAKTAATSATGDAAKKDGEVTYDSKVLTPRRLIDTHN